MGGRTLEDARLDRHRGSQPSGLFLGWIGDRLMDADASSSQSQCPLCGGGKSPGTTTYTVDFGPSIVIVRNVPAMVCDQCGEEWIPADAASKLEQLTTEARQRGEQVAIIAM